MFEIFYYWKNGFWDGHCGPYFALAAAVIDAHQKILGCPNLEMVDICEVRKDGSVNNVRTVHRSEVEQPEYVI